MHCQNLESRTLFSVTAADIHDTLYVWGDAQPNGVSVVKDGSDLVVKKYVGSGYSEFFRTPAAGIGQIRIYGYGGPDTLQVADNVTNTAVIYGGKGADYIKGGGGSNDLWGHGNWAGDPDHSAASDDGAADTLISGKGNSVLRGQKGNDTFLTDDNATSGADVMYGGDGDDTFTIRGRGGASYAHGDAGNDRFIPLQGSEQIATFYGGAGNDSADYRNWTVAVTVKPDGVNHSGRTYGDRNQIIGDDVEIVYGTDQGDTLAGTDKKNVFYGRGGGDLINGFGGNDQLYGGDGNDIIAGGDGDDLITGNDGNDQLFGFAGKDNILGGEGNDRLEGGDDNDTLSGQAGNDTLLGHAGNDVLRGGDGNDELRGGSGHDALYGDKDNDWLYGDSGNDKLVGGHGSDYLVTHDWVAGNDAAYGDNEDGSGATGSLDVLWADAGAPFPDFAFGVEAITY